MVKRALLVGINYVGHSAGVLRGCHNDVDNMRAYIRSQGYGDNDVMVLMDKDGTPGHLMPTRVNITNAIKWLMKDLKAGDSVFFHYSGHGGQVKDSDGDEEDGMDETLCPLDYPTAGQITDDELHVLIVKAVPDGVKMVCVFDCCHSGSILDLPYTYQPGASGQVTHKVLDFATMKEEALRFATNMQRGDVNSTDKAAHAQSFFAMLCGFLSAHVGMGTSSGPDPSTGASAGANATGGFQQTSKKQGGNITLITGCMDNQTSADATIGNQASGALTWGLLKTMQDRGGQLSREELLVETRKNLSGKYTQIPQLCSGMACDMKQPFQL